MDYLDNRWSETTTGTDSGCTATHAAETDKQHFVTHIAGFSDLDTLVQILDGSTIIWEIKLDVSLEPNFFITVGSLPITPGTAAGLKIDGSTATCRATMVGFTIP